MTLEAIEADERVTDPLGAAPDVPFGHLNPLWRAFADRIETGDELWRFQAPNVSDWGFVRIHRGYAQLRNGQVLQHVTTEKYVPDGSDEDAQKSPSGA